MHEPSPRSSRLAIAGSLAALFIAGGGGFLLGRATQPEPPVPTISPTPAATPSPAATRPAAERVLARADLIAFGNAAADAAASDASAPVPGGAASGQRFDISLPFGCDGPAPEGSDAALQWRYDSKASTLRIRAEPANWAAADWWSAVPAGVEGLEGFWIARPWSSRESCSSGGAIAAPSGTESITVPGQTLGLAQLVTTSTPRQLRRNGRPYESVTRVAADALDLDGGLRLRLRGRIAQFPEGRTVRCTQRGGREQRPVCLIAATFDEVAIENPATGETIATWSPTVANPAHSDD